MRDDELCIVYLPIERLAVTRAVNYRREPTSQILKLTFLVPTRDIESLKK